MSNSSSRTLPPAASRGSALPPLLPREAALQVLHRLWNQALRAGPSVHTLLREAFLCRMGTPVEVFLPQPSQDLGIWTHALCTYPDEHIFLLLLTTCQAITDHASLLECALQWPPCFQGSSLLEEAHLVLLDAVTAHAADNATVQ